jgi:NTP pyrophosphatase (non-canonical NTP hydrolase)
LGTLLPKFFHYQFTNMTLTYPHAGNDLVADRFIDLVEGTDKYEVAYKLVGMVEAKRSFKVVSDAFIAQMNKLKAKAEFFIDLANVTWTPEKWAYQVVNMLINRANEQVATEQRLAREAEELQEAADEFTFGYNEGLTTNRYDGKRFKSSSYYALGMVAGTLVKKNNLTVELDDLLDQVADHVNGFAPSGGVLNQAKVMVGLVVPEPEVDESEDTYEWDDYDYTNYYAYDDYYASYKEALAVS